LEALTLETHTASVDERRAHRHIADAVGRGSNVVEADERWGDGRFHV
jgi:hypothetical protein